MGGSPRTAACQKTEHHGAGVRRFHVAGLAALACFLTGCQDPQHPPEFQSAVAAFRPLLHGLRHFEGRVEIFTSSSCTQTLVWNLSGVDPRCGSDSANIDRPTSRCGLHLHSGRTCTAGSMGGHYYSSGSDSGPGSGDPWLPVHYFTAPGTTQSTGYFAEVSSGLTTSGLHGHALVITDADGAFMACGLVCTLPEVASWPVSARGEQMHCSTTQSTTPPAPTSSSQFPLPPAVDRTTRSASPSSTSSEAAGARTLQKSTSTSKVHDTKTEVTSIPSPQASSNEPSEPPTTTKMLLTTTSRTQTKTNSGGEVVTTTTSKVMTTRPQIHSSSRLPKKLTTEEPNPTIKRSHRSSIATSTSKPTVSEHTANPTEVQRTTAYSHPADGTSNVHDTTVTESARTIAASSKQHASTTAATHTPAHTKKHRSTESAQTSTASATSATLPQRHDIVSTTAGIPTNKHSTTQQLTSPHTTAAEASRRSKTRLSSVSTAAAQTSTASAKHPTPPEKHVSTTAAIGSKKHSTTQMPSQHTTHTAAQEPRKETSQATAQSSTHAQSTATPLASSSAASFRNSTREVAFTTLAPEPAAPPATVGAVVVASALCSTMLLLLVCCGRSFFQAAKSSTDQLQQQQQQQPENAQLFDHELPAIVGLASASAFLTLQGDDICGSSRTTFDRWPYLAVGTVSALLWLTWLLVTSFITSASPTCWSPRWRILPEAGWLYLFSGASYPLFDDSRQLEECAWSVFTLVLLYHWLVHATGVKCRPVRQRRVAKYVGVDAGLQTPLLADEAPAEDIQLQSVVEVQIVRPLVGISELLWKPVMALLWAWNTARQQQLWRQSGSATLVAAAFIASALVMAATGMWSAMSGCSKKVGLVACIGGVSAALTTLVAVLEVHPGLVWDSLSAHRRGEHWLDGVFAPFLPTGAAGAAASMNGLLCMLVLLAFVCRVPPCCRIRRRGGPATESEAGAGQREAAEQPAIPVTSSAEQGAVFVPRGALLVHAPTTSASLNEEDESSKEVAASPSAASSHTQPRLQRDMTPEVVTLRQEVSDLLVALHENENQLVRARSRDKDAIMALKLDLEACNEAMLRAQRAHDRELLAKDNYVRELEGSRARSQAEVEEIMDVMTTRLAAMKDVKELCQDQVAVRDQRILELEADLAKLHRLQTMPSSSAPGASESTSSMR